MHRGGDMYDVSRDLVRIKKVDEDYYQYVMRAIRSGLIVYEKLRLLRPKTR